MSNTSAFFTSSAVRLYSATAIDNPTGNLLVSPVSIIYTALLAYLGAKGQTKRNLDESLHLSKYFKNDDVLKKSFLTVLDGFKHSDASSAEKNDDNLQLKFANGVFLQSNFTFMKSYTDDASRIFEANTEEKDFLRQPEESRKDINQWVANRTNGLIPDLLPENSIGLETRAVIVNALYLKGKWEIPFESSLTGSDEFTQLNGKKVSTKFMQRSDWLDHVHDADLGLQYIELPYVGGASLFVLLPEKVDGLRDIEKRLSDGLLDNLRVKARSSRPNVELKFPKLKASFGTELVEILKKLGIQDAFDLLRADFTGMVPSRQVSITNAFHKTVISIDEDGTEAVASTEMSFEGRHGLPGPTVRFSADHPFLYGIRHDPTDIILFIGRFEEPSASE